MNTASFIKAALILSGFGAAGASKLSRSIELNSFNKPHIVITGGSRGIGRATAKKLCELGCQVTILSRSDPNLKGVVHVPMDITNFGQLRAWAMKQPPGSISTLINNAGSMYPKMSYKSPGIEMTWALHVQSHFELVESLISNKVFADSAHVITVSSGGMYLKRLDISLINKLPGSYSKYKSYANAKRAQVVLSKYWSRRYPSIVFSCMHPGWVDTQALRTQMPFFRLFMSWFLRTPESASLGIIALIQMQSKDRHFPSGKFWLDAKLAPEHVFQFTHNPYELDQQLYDTLCGVRNSVKNLS